MSRDRVVSHKVVKALVPVVGYIKDSSLLQSILFLQLYLIASYL